MYVSKIEEPRRLEFEHVGKGVYKAGYYTIERYPENNYRGERWIARGPKAKFLGMRVTKEDAVLLCEISAGYL
jgi:hypothetical protein